MALQYLRLGFTETTLLFIYFIEKYHKELFTNIMLTTKKN
jgi:hypothetical protein